MKKYLLIFFISVYANCCFGQENFEGHIIYNIYSKARDSSEKFMDVFFKKNKLRINLAQNPKKSYKPTEFIYDFEKGTSYDINLEEHLVLSGSLKKKYLYSPFIYDLATNFSKKIQGFNCLKYDVLRNSLRTQYLQKIYAWFSNDFRFPVPDSFRFVQPFLIFNGNTFSLETETMLISGEDLSIDTVSITAVSIKSKKIDDIVFEIGKNFVIKDINEFQKEMISNFIPPKIVADNPPIKKKNSTSTNKLPKKIRSPSKS